MKFKEGDRVRFINQGSWYDDFNGYVGTIAHIEFDEYADMTFIILAMDKDVSNSNCGLKRLCVTPYEIKLLEEER